METKMTIRGFDYTPNPFIQLKNFSGSVIQNQRV